MNSNNKKDISCTNCGTSMTCTSNNLCWCYELPHIQIVEKSTQCLCNSCLITRQAMAVNQGQSLTTKTKQQIKKLGPTANPTEGIDYIMENGLLVMSRWYLLRRGHCCENGCRHCPYSED